MSFGRIWAVCLRYYYFFGKLDHLCDLMFWPAMDILLWGITSIWIQKNEQGIPNVALAILTGLVLWQSLWRACYEVSVNLLQEFWNRNLVNLFSTPLKLREWMCSIMLVGLSKILIALTFGSLLVWILYSLNIFSIGWAFLPFAASLTISGWILGFLSASIIIYFGLRVQMLAWMTAYLFIPFSAVYYPVNALPKWAQSFSHALPTSYIFEGMRQILYEQTFSGAKLGISFGLNALYFVLSIILFRFMFEKSRNKGLSRLE
ncbi:MAG TPA: ABC transporter permease [Rhabdochlamydiaceae bacterium]|nr:ABC transporter permease [Rhabdochlamydiaceae bacterium]